MININIEKIKHMKITISNNQTVSNKSPSRASTAKDDKNISKLLMVDSEYVTKDAAKNENPKKFINTLHGMKQGIVLGKGGFGEVFLGTRESDGRKFAVKRVKKIKKTKEFVMKEVAIMKSLKNIMICNLLGFVEGKISFYLILEYCSGDLFDKLSVTEIGFSREELKFVATSLTLALEYTHNQLIAHRDIKSENVLITSVGRIKLGDFGLAKKLKEKREKMEDIVGTDSHLAAEIFRKEEYGIEVDYWALGVTLYRLRTKEEPFHGSRELPMKKHSRVMEWFALEDLIVGLTATHPEARLGFYSTNDVRTHPFFTDVDFDSILLGTHTSPFTN